MKSASLLLSSLSALALSACAVGPEYATPQPPPASSGPFLSQSSVLSAAPVAADWWKLYNDPVLDGLIQDALTANTDIRVAVARVEKARAALSGARGDRLPQTSVSAGANYTRLPEAQRAPGAPQEDWSVDAGLSLSYEVDLFGRIRRKVEAARGDWQAAEADADAVRIVVIADTTRAYADAASSAARLKVARHIVDLLDQLVSVTKRRHDAGLATGLDVARVVTLHDQRLADIPSIEAERQTALFQLATLTGRAPAALPEIATRRSIGLEVTDPIPVGDGAALIARRPDIRAAEQRLAADTARVGVATADLYPRITLGGSIGSTGPNIADAFGAGPLRWLLGPLISWTFPNQAAIRARINGAKADSKATLATFDGVVLNALRETETALTVYARALERRQALRSARDAAEQAATIARAQQREGATDALQLLDTERTFSEAQAALALQDAQVSRAQIDLFRALGGGWSNAPTAI